MNTQIILIPVDYSNSRKVCELIENQTFETQVDAIRAAKKDLVSDEEEPNDILIFTMTDFMDTCNNQELDTLTEYFITYITIRNNA
tara:strand:+ start:1078 stop:1335 length:258 start_codon:yes stop_codon:yes gene_type:complete